MNNTITKIQFIGNDKGYLDVSPTTNFPITFSISDIRDISKKTGTFSKSIELPNTKNNNKLLGYYFDINITNDTFNINTKRICSIIQNGVTILDNATIQLISINNSQSNSSYEEKITYTVLIKDTTGDFFSKINTKYLSDLDFSNFDHLYNASGVTDSFDNTYIDGYKYVMAYNPVETNPDVVFNLQEFQPGIYVRNYLDNIFANAGYSYSVTDKPFIFDKLIVPYNGDIIPVPEQDYINREVFANTIGSQTSTLSYTNVFNNTTHFGTFNTQKNITNEIKDNNNLYDASNSVYRLPTSIATSEYLTYLITLNYTINVTNTNAFGITYISPSSTNALNVKPFFIITKNSVEINTPIVSPSITTITPNAYAIDNGNIAVGTTLASNSSISLFTNKTQTLTIKIPGNLVSADDFRIKFGIEAHNNLALSVNSGWVDSSNILSNVDYSFIINSMEIDVNFENKGLIWNDKIEINKFIPKQIKQSDFVKSILTMFNMYVEIDKNDFHKLILTRRDNYYDQGNEKDWTKKLAKNEDQEVQFLPELVNKRMILTYKADTDIANKEYFNATEEIYGQVQFTFDNEYVKETTKIELIFSPTPMISVTPLNAVLPVWNAYAPKTNIRVLIDNGELPCSGYTINNYNGNNTYNTWSYNKYPLISHFDSDYNPDYDLNFGLNDFYFYGDYDTLKTNNNLFNNYWRRTINQINTSKMLIAYFDLNENDIANLSLADKIRIDNSYWNINKIIDYDGNNKKLTKVELISVDESLTYGHLTQNNGYNASGQTYTFSPNNSNWGSSIITQTQQEVAKQRQSYTNTILTSAPVIINGNNNLLASSVSNALVIGDNNIIAPNSPAYVFGDNNATYAKGSFTIGTGNTVNPSAINSLVIGSNLTQTSPNTITSNNFDARETIKLGVITLNSENVANTTDISYSALTDLKYSGTMVSNTTYFITDKNIWLLAVSGNTFSNAGKIKLRIPKSTYYEVNGSNLGVWHSSILSVNPDDICIYGCKLWSNVSGNVGAIDRYSTYNGNIGTDLNSEWRLISSTGSTYEDKIFDIQYDFDNDIITSISDNKGNRFFYDSFDTSFPPNYYELIDWNDDSIRNNTGGLIVNNRTNGGYSGYDYGINNNQTKYIIGNLCLTTAIQYNKCTYGIIANTNSGDISYNEVQDIQNNSNNGEITYNKNNGYIRYNTIDGYIYHNINNGNIADNTQTSGTCNIENNTNNGYIAGSRTASVSGTIVNL